MHKQYIRPQFVINALQYLKQNHSSYTNVKVNSTWHEISEAEDAQFWDAATHNPIRVTDQEDHLDVDESNQKSESQKEDGTITDSDDEMEENNPSEFNTNLQNKRSV